MDAEHPGVASRGERVVLSEAVDESPELWDSGFGEVAGNLLTSAVRCFSASGFHGTTTRDITSVIGLPPPGALYVHFPSKERVLFEIIRTGHESSLGALEEVEDSDNALSRTRALVERFVGRHARHHVVGRVSQYELEALAPEHYDEVLGLRRRSTAMFREAVTRGIEEGAFVDIDVPRVVRAMLSLGVDLVRWYRPDGRDTPEQLGEFYADLALGMVTSRDDDATNPAGQDRSTR